jgi:hypothetical protein
MPFISNGTTILNNGAFSVSLGSMVLLQTQTPSGNSSISFTSNIDSTYPIYKFEFINVHPANNDITFQFQCDTGTNTNYNQTITSSAFRATLGENDSSPALSVLPSADQANGTGYQLLAGSVGSDADQGLSGDLYIYNPSSSTFVKHFIANVNSSAHSDRTNLNVTAGYINTATAITRFDFKFSSGNVDAGLIKLYGIKGS